MSLIFGKIEYLNLLPFHVFMKRYAKTSRHSHSINYKKGVPSKVNRDFKYRRIDAAFISSIEAKKYAHVNLGIIAKKEVQSVLLLQNGSHIDDKASASSNQLARVLGLEGEVVIGDRALRLFLEGVEAINLAQEWNKRYNLPFVFALLCFHNHKKSMKKIEKNFTKTAIKIPYYLLKKASIEASIPISCIKTYLTHISYTLDYKSHLALKKFYTLSK